MKTFWPGGACPLRPLIPHWNMNEAETVMKPQFFFLNSQTFKFFRFWFVKFVKLFKMRVFFINK